MAFYLPAYFTRYGTNGNNRMTGSDYNEIFYTRNGRDTVHAGGGRDIIIGGEGRDYFYGDDGNDTLYGKGGFDFLHGGRGEDYLYGGDGRDWLWGDDGNDWLYGQNGRDSLYGGRGDDHLYGGSSDDTLIGGEGADVLNGGSGVDTASYYSSSTGVFISLDENFFSPIGDEAAGDALGDTLINIENLTGSTHDDVLIGDEGDNVLNGLSGDDVLVGAGGSDTLNGSTGNDTVFYIGNSINVNLSSGYGTGGIAAGDRYISIENVTVLGSEVQVTGNDFDNILDVYAVDSEVYGRGGDDVIISTPMGNYLDGGDGNDTLSLISSSIDIIPTENFGVSVDLARGTSQSLDPNSQQSGDTLVSFENVSGSLLSDVIRGTAQDNRLEGNEGDDRIEGRGGDDTLFGGDGNDIIEGGDGDDVLVGGQGADRFVFDDYWDNDIITDFDVNRDTLDFDDVRRLGDDDMTLTQQGNDTIITFDEDNAGSIILRNVDANDLHDDNNDGHFDNFDF